LRYYLLDSAPPRHAVRVLVEKEIRLPGLSLVLAIIGSSHFLEIRSGETILSELLTCPNPAITAALGSGSAIGKLESWRRGLRRDGLRYQFECWHRVHTDGQFALETARLSAPAANRLLYVFPPEDGGSGAVTCLEWQQRGNQAIVATYHTFPDELAIIHSRSLVDTVETGAQP